MKHRWWHGRAKRERDFQLALYAAQARARRDMLARGLDPDAPGPRGPDGVRGPTGPIGPTATPHCG